MYSADNNSNEDSVNVADEPMASVDELTRQGDFDTLIASLNEQLQSTQSVSEKNEIVGQLVAAYLNNSQNEEALLLLDKHFEQYEEEIDIGLIRTYAETLDSEGRYADAIEYYQKFKEGFDVSDPMYDEFIKDTDNRIAELKELL